jgi:hypothetical protein
VSERRKVEAGKLNDVMQFDHVIRVWPGGLITEPMGEPYAPEVSDNGESVSEPWSLMTGYSGQYRYSGPCMHASEYIGGRIARDILAQPGWYVALVAEADSCDSDGCEECNPFGDTPCPVDCDLCASDEPAGWVVAYVEADCEGHPAGPYDPMGQEVTCDGSCVTFPRSS